MEGVGVGRLKCSYWGVGGVGGAGEWVHGGGEESENGAKFQLCWL